ncbi:S8 family serine peptidase [Sphingomonas sp. AX6]|uniref:S8 family serine peptidase n=1 Tax=Sphingomonas sp. AX6 TaxID=2653171 RepID=UPI0012F2758B|nr:S8 family serine peptidase [Sphingomonas sp. AX6]VXC96110.1 conserved hypothetical protein [Sphingomonas sp. AX6]
MTAAHSRHLLARLTIGLLGLLAALVAPVAVRAQLVPSLPGTIDRTLGGVRDTLEPIDRTVDGVRTLARDQLQQTRDLARQYPNRIAIDPDGNAVRAGEVTVLDADAAVIRAAEVRGFGLIETVDLDGLGIGYARFSAPRGMSIGRALSRMRGVSAGRDVSADPLHFTSGGLGEEAVATGAPATPQVRRRIGIIDGGVPRGTAGLVEQQGFATGGPRPHDHAAAIASLLTGGGGIRPSAAGASLYVADVYGSDPAGGNATAIAKALAWMTRERVPVVVVSLVGPSNPLLARVVAAARQRGTMVVAAVGNDGPAAPPAYPASYPQAIAVTGVDARGRPLIEAGRARKLDYAAPGADMLALAANGRALAVRGTSFAVPFVAARISAHLAEGHDRAIAAVDGEAKRGERGTGRGIVCSACRTTVR